jgi:hypothetical protein
MTAGLKKGLPTPERPDHHRPHAERSKKQSTGKNPGTIIRAELLVRPRKV